MKRDLVNSDIGQQTADIENQFPGIRENLPIQVGSIPQKNLPHAVAKTTALLLWYFKKTAGFSLAFTLALIGSFPVFALVILLGKKSFSSDEASLNEKIAVPSLPWLVISLFRSWLAYNKIVHRLNGEKDQEMKPTSPQARTDLVHVTIALFANISSIAGVTLVTLPALASATPAAQWGVAVLLGIFNYIFNIYNDLSDTYRKHKAYWDERGVEYAHFHEQPIIRWFYRMATPMGVFGREFFLPLSAYVTSSLVSQSVSDTLLAAGESEDSVLAIARSIHFISYLAMANIFTSYELYQFSQLMKLDGKTFPIENYLSRKERFFVLRFIGKLQSGELLLDVLKPVTCGSVIGAVSIALFLTWLSISAFLGRALVIYFNSTSDAKVHQGDEGVVMAYFMGATSALKISPQLFWVVVGLSISLGLAATVARLGTAKEYTEKYYESSVLSFFVCCNRGGKIAPETELKYDQIYDQKTNLGVGSVA